LATAELPNDLAKVCGVFFDDPTRLLDVVTRLTEKHEAGRARPWAVADAPDDFVQGMLRGIVGIALPISRLEGKAKMSQNRPATDLPGIVQGLREDYRMDLAASVEAANVGRLPKG